MSILADLTAIVTGLGIPVETGVFSDAAPVEYVVITPLADTFPLFADNRPDCEVQEARLSLFSMGNYMAAKTSIVKALLDGNFTITARQYIGHEDDTKYHNYAIDAANIYTIGE